MARGLKFWILNVEELYSQCSEIKDADQLCSYCAADLCLCFSHMKKSRFSYDGAYIILRGTVLTCIKTWALKLTSNKQLRCSPVTLCTLVYAVPVVK